MVHYLNQNSTLDKNEPQINKFFGFEDYLGDAERQITYACEEDCEFLLIPKHTSFRVLKYIMALSIERILISLSDNFYFFKDWGIMYLKSLKEITMIKTVKKNNFIIKGDEPMDNFYYLL